MKPLFTLACLCLVVLFSCKKDKQSPSSTSIIGKWIQTKAITQEIVNNYAQSPIEDILSDPNNYVQFNTDGTGTLSSGGSGTYSLTNFNYNLSGNVLTLKTTNYTEVDTIKTMTANSLVIRNVNDFNSNGTHYRDITDDYYTR